MIKLLGKINIPTCLIEYLQTAQPERVATHVTGVGFREQIQILKKERNIDIENYKFYTQENTVFSIYRKDWFKTIVPDDFLAQQGLESVINAVVLRVDPGQFQAPHIDRYKTSVYPYDADIEFDNIVRLWIPVQDGKMGQALFVENEVLYNFKSGDVYTFGNYDFHSGTNAGLDVRYTLLVYTKKKN